MANLKLTYDDFASNDFELIAIHSTLKDFKLAYLINNSLNVLLAKSEKEITIQSKNGIGFFSRFIFEDEIFDLSWNLIKNKTNLVSNQPNIGIFNEDNITLNLIPEYKIADYLLKIDNVDLGFNCNEIVKKISTINKISTVYKVDTTKLKSINNLIF